ncbi:MAG TPA: glycosyltransferase family 2 protein [Bacteroidia bacterium]
MNKIKVSIITICRNSEKTIADTIRSVQSQTYSNIEHIVVDGLSSDQTIPIIESFKNDKMVFLSEEDFGLYDALNKGFKLATGNLLGVLHSDDFLYSDDAIEKLVQIYTENPDADAISASVNIYKNENFDQPYRKYKANNFKLWQFRIGMQPPHPGFYITSKAFENLGYFNSAYKISGDFDWLLRGLVKLKLKVIYSDLVLVKMRDGGVSSSGLESKKKMNRENLKSLKSHGIYSNKLMIYLKYFIKIFQIRSI